MPKSDYYLKLDDIGLFKQRRKIRGFYETKSQYERAVEIRDAFAECMWNAVNGTYCAMPMLCACDSPGSGTLLSCAHLTVDYSSFTGKGIPLTGQARRIIDARLHVIGTQVYRGSGSGTYPGDAFAQYAGKQKIPPRVGKSAPSEKASPGKVVRAAPPAPRGFWARMFG